MQYKLNISLILIVIIIASSINDVSMAQVKFRTVSLRTGIGGISGLFESQSSAYTAGAIDLQISSLKNIDFRLQGFFTKSLDVIFGTQKSNSYYPYVYGGTMSAYSTWPVVLDISAEAGAGTGIMFDRSYSDSKGSSLSFILHAALMYHPQAEFNQPILIGIGAEYNASLAANQANYYVYYFIFSYAFNNE
jgi:hypothetical protein